MAGIRGGSLGKAETNGGMSSQRDIFSRPKRGKKKKKGEQVQREKPMDVWSMSGFESESAVTMSAMQPETKSKFKSKFKSNRDRNQIRVCRLDKRWTRGQMEGRQGAQDDML